jgi:SH3-like domain-containing protein
MNLSKTLTVGLLTLGTITLSALPSFARPATIDYEANIRVAPSMYSDRVDGLPSGTPLEVLRILPDTDSNTQSYWYYVRSTGQLRTEGWVTSSLVRFQPSNQQYGTLTGDAGDVINIRSGPTTQSRVLHTGVRGDLVRVGRSRYDGADLWHSVTFANGSAGWVREDLINVWPKGCVITCPAY